MVLVRHVPRGLIPEQARQAARHVQHCTPAREAIHAPAVRQQEHAPGLTADRLRRQGRQAAVRLPPGTLVLTALKRNVCMKDAPAVQAIL